jgi:CRISPR-associated protein Cas5h
LTYPVPSFTALRGLIANCLGRPRRAIETGKNNVNLLVDDLDLQSKVKIGIELLRRGSKNRELAKLLKFNGQGSVYQRNFPSSPIFKEFLARPIYRVYLVSGGEILQQVHAKLLDPERPLYLGQSDDLVDLYDVTTPQPVEEEESEMCHTLFEGVGEGCELIKLPYSFDESGERLRYAGQPPHVLSLPIETKPAKLPKRTRLFKVEDRYVAAY